METQAKSKREGLLKISDLARETGVAAGTIKFYIRQGLLAQPTLKTGRNMAYYDRSFIPRIRFIKELQSKRFLPLDVIKAIIEHNNSVISSHEVETLLNLEGTFYEAIHYVPGQAPIPRDEVESRYGTTEEDLNLLIEFGVLSPVTRDGVEYFEGDDVLMLETFLAMDKAGLTKDLIPHATSLPIYVESIGKLARDELKMFTQSVTGRYDTARVANVAIASMKLAEQFIVLLRRKLLLKAIQDLREESSAAQDTQTAESSG